MSKKSLAKRLGAGLARVQALGDDVINLGFRSLKNVGSGKPKKQGAVGKAMRSTARFLGEMGQEFYQKYDQIKSEKGKRQEK